MRKEVLTTTQAYLSTLFNLQATEDQVRHIQEILGEAWVGRLNQDGWYLQHIEELQTIASLLNLPAQTTWESEQRQAQAELEHTVNSVMKQIRPIASTTRIDVLVALGRLFFVAVRRLKDDHEVEAFFHLVLPACAMAGVTLQQAFQWAALPQYRLIAYQAQYPDWQPQAREEGPINPVHQAISFAIEQWQRGIRLPTGQFGMAEGLFEQTFSSDVNEEE